MLGKLRFEVVELGVRPAPFVRAAKSLQSLDENPAVPRTVINRDPPGAGHVTPEPPEIMGGLFFVRWFRDRDHAVFARIYRAREPANGASFSGGIPAFEDPDDRASLLRGASDRAMQTAQPLVPFGLVVGL